jgi:F-type H+-transporting ATPase subunit delta
MKIGKQARRDGKALFNASRVNGVLDEAKVRTVVSRMIAAKPRDYLATLRHFQRLVKLDVDRRTARVENAVETSSAQKQIIESELTRRYGPGINTTYWVNPALIGGVRIKVGNDIYDGSVATRLHSLATGG